MRCAGNHKERCNSLVVDVGAVDEEVSLSRRQIGAVVVVREGFGDAVRRVVHALSGFLQEPFPVWDDASLLPFCTSRTSPNQAGE